MEKDEATKQYEPLIANPTTTVDTETLNPAPDAFTAENPDPNSNHDWYAQFDPTSKEYHGSLDKRIVPLDKGWTDKKIPESMPTEYAPGMNQEQAIAIEDPAKDDEICIKMQAGYKFCGELKKRLTEFGKSIQTTAEKITNKLKENETSEIEEEKSKKYTIVTDKIKNAMVELKKWIEESEKENVDDMSEM